MENVIKVKCDRNFILECIDCWDFSNTRRYHNYLANTTRNDDGTFNYEWLFESKEDDEYFKITEVKEGDILMGGHKDYYKNRRWKMYYKVIKKDDDNIVLGVATTFRKASAIEDEEQSE